MNESKATRYQRLRRRRKRSQTLSGGLVLALIALTPVAVWLRDITTRLTADLPPVLGSPFSVLLFVLVVVLLWEAAGVPALFYGGRTMDGARGGDGITADEVLVAQLRATPLAYLAAVAAAAIVLISVRSAGGLWWILAAAGLAALWALMLVLGPFVLSWLADVRPLRRPALSGALEELARRVKVPIGGIHEWAVAEGSSTTALVTGVGRSRRVLVSSQIVRGWSDQEIAVVVAHELSHLAHHDLWRALALNVAVLWAGLGLSHVVLSVAGGRLGLGGPGDLASLPMIALVTSAAWVLATPVRNAQSREHERRADLFALQATGAAEAFRAAIRRLGAQHLSEERPSRLTRWLHHAHPSVAERLKVADEWTEEAGL